MIQQLKLMGVLADPHLYQLDIYEKFVLDGASTKGSGSILVPFHKTGTPELQPDPLHRLTNMVEDLEESF